MKFEAKFGSVTLDVPVSPSPFRGRVVLEVTDKDAVALKAAAALSPLEARVLADALLRFAAAAVKS